MSSNHETNSEMKQRIDQAHPQPSRSRAPVPTEEDVARLDELLRSPHSSMRQIAMVVEASPGLRRIVLRTTNSAEFGLTQPISETPHAVAVLGLTRLRRLVSRLLASLPAKASEPVADADAA